ncbi:DsbA family protein [Pantoea agglomerans]|uniref:DsbA family protein n=1 Tax=Enterobacter agglomerans TaxID=549 RepID=UPI0011E5A066|nr:hypothetical protein [Pantoea agglomerans]
MSWSKSQLRADWACIGGEIASDYLVAHPDILIEVIKNLQARQAEMQRSARIDAALKGHQLFMQLENIPVKGPVDSGGIVNEFSDYECSACSMMAPVMEKTMAANAGVRFVFRDWTRYPESTKSSRRGLEIFRKLGTDAYMKYQKSIYSTGHNEGRLTGDDIKKQQMNPGHRKSVWEGIRRLNVSSKPMIH